MLFCLVVVAVVAAVVVWGSPNSQLRLTLHIKVMLHSGYFYFLLHFFKWLQKYVVDPVLWIFTGYTTLGGRQKKSKFVDAFEGEILPTDSSGVNFINILSANFSYERHFGSFFYIIM